MKFDASKDINIPYLLKRAKREATLIHTKESTRHGRSYKEILTTTLYGHAAEVYLIQHHGFTDNFLDYKDVIDPDGNEVEVKVTEGDYYVPYVLERCNKSAKDSWRKYPKILYIFVNNKKDTLYNLYGVYHWNGKSFERVNDE